jgi:alkylation response protein AidB-like acyl-CoA dehydrogenase
MTYAELDYNLTDEQLATRDMVRRFGAEVVRPGGIELDKLSDPADVIADDSKLWDLVRQYRELGLHKTGITKELGGTAEDMDPMMYYLITEEMGYADAGFAISMGAGGMFYSMCQRSRVPELRQLAQEFAEDAQSRLMSCWGIIEPNRGGGDWTLAGNDPSIKPGVQAELKGDYYIINGQKAAWVSNGTIATHCVLHAGMDNTQGMAGQKVILVPLDLPGVSRGKPLDKMGQRALNQGEIFFDNVEVPREYLLEAEDDQTASGRGRQPPMAGMAVQFAGLARAALDEAIAYSKQREQVGKPIIQHQNVGLKIFEMFMQVEAARSFARRMYMYNAFSGDTSVLHSMAGKWLSTETAFKVASTAIQIFGGNGLSKEYVIEKIFRDARTAMIEDGVNETLALAVVPYI